MKLNIASIRARDPDRFASLNRGDVAGKRKGKHRGAFKRVPGGILLLRVCRANIDTTKTFATILIPGLKLESEANRHTHWRDRDRRVRTQKRVVSICLLRETFPPLPIICRIVRVGCRELDSDNATGSAKAVRDAIAAHYGIDDRDSRIEWDVTQEKGKQYAVRIEIAAKGGQS